MPFEISTVYLLYVNFTHIRNDLGHNVSLLSISLTSIVSLSYLFPKVIIFLLR